MKPLVDPLHVGVLAGRLRIKILIATVAIGIVPLAAMGWLSMDRSTAALSEVGGRTLELAALDSADKIDRNLSERYRDVQTFAANPRILGTPADAQEIVNFLTGSYGIYDLMIVADLDGKIMAINTIDGLGEPIETKGLIGTDVSDREWFQVVRNGDTPEGGTYYTDAERSPEITAVYGKGLLTLPFTAPVYDRSGRLAAVWHTQASFERIVTDIMAGTRQEFVATGASTIETQVVGADGGLIEDSSADPSMSSNLLEAGSKAARFSVEGQGSRTAGYTRELHAQRGVEQFNGWALSKGALGFDGYGWGVLVRQDVDEALGAVTPIRNGVVTLGALAMLVIGALSYLLARRISRPIAEVADRDENIAAAIEEMNASIQEVAANAIEASRAASEAVTVAQTTSDSISKLQESSDEIGNVITVISSIAEQTRLLAVNATIEAAKAGEAGKGFSLVANGAKELANQTAKATEEISSRIQNIRADTAGAVQASLQIGETIDRIKEISGTIASAVGERPETTAEIGQEIEEAASGTGDIELSTGEPAAGSPKQLVGNHS